MPCHRPGAIDRDRRRGRHPPRRLRRVLIPVRPGRRDPGKLAEALEPAIVGGLGAGITVTPFAVGTPEQVQSMAAFLQAMVGWLPGRSIQPRAVVANDPVAAIVAESAGHDLVILGAPEGGHLVGSVAGRVLAEAGCPTMVIWKHLAQVDPQRILVPSDGSARARVAVALAFALAEGAGSVVTVLHVLEASSGDDSGRCVGVLEDAQQLRRPEIRLETMVVRADDVGAAIRDAASSIGADLLLVGSHIDAGGGPVLGPRVVSLVEDPPCPLALVHVPTPVD